MLSVILGRPLSKNQQEFQGLKISVTYDGFRADSKDKILIRKDGILRKQSPSGEKSMDHNFHNDSSYK